MFGAVGFQERRLAGAQSAGPSGTGASVGGGFFSSAMRRGVGSYASRGLARSVAKAGKTSVKRAPKKRKLIKKVKGAKKGGKGAKKSGPKAIKYEQNALVPLGNRSVVPWKPLPSIRGANALKKAGLRQKLKGKARMLKTHFTDPRKRRKMIVTAMKGLGKTALVGAAGLGFDYVAHRLAGGRPMSAQEIRDISRQAGVNMMQDAMQGKKLTTKSVRDNVVAAAANRMASSPKKGVSARRQVAAKHMVALRKELIRRHRERMKRRHQTSSGQRHRIIPQGQWGSGGRKRRAKKRKKGRATKKGKKRTRKTGKGRRKKKRGLVQLRDLFD